MKRILFGLLALIVSITTADAACYQWSKTASANGSADPSINFAEGMSPSSVNDSARAMMARLAECRDDLSGLLVTAGTSTAYTVTTNQGLPSTPSDGQSIAARFHTSNGAAATLAADGGTAYAIQSAVGAAVLSSTLNTNGVYRLTFKLSSTSWLLQDFYNAPLAANSVTYDKIQQVTAARLLGNPTGGAANVSEISLGAGLSFSGSTLAASISSTDLLGHIAGLQLSTAGGSSSFGVGSGVATDTAGSGTLLLSSSYTKTTASWAVGSGNGALDTGSIANATWYHAFIIKRPDTAVVDICVSTLVNGCSAGVGNIPAAYTLKRRVGSMKTDGAVHWLAFTQTGDTFIWGAHINDSSSTNIATTTWALTGVPTGVVVTALARLSAAPGGTSSIVVRSLQEADFAVGGASPDADLTQNTAGNSVLMNVARITDTSAQLAAKATNNGVAFNFFVYGWIDSRGKN